MKVKILEHEKDKLRFVIEGEGHTFVNALVEEVLLDSEVDVAKYVIEYQFSDPEVLVTMKPKAKKTPEDVVIRALENISHRCDALLTTFKN